MDDQEAQREQIILERILTLKHNLKEGRAGPVELHELGTLYFLIDNFAPALEYLSRLLEEYPDYIELAAASTLRVYCHIKLGQFDAAEKLVQDRLNVYKTDTRLFAMLAHIYEKTERMAEAIETHRRILEIDPDNLNSMNSLGYLLTLHGGEAQQAEALNNLKKALARKPNYPAYLDSFGVALARGGHTEHARRALLKALQFAPQNTEIMEHLKGLFESPSGRFPTSAKDQHGENDDRHAQNGGQG